jgi:hypothetical protein
MGSAVFPEEICRAAASYMYIQPLGTRGQPAGLTSGTSNQLVASIGDASIGDASARRPGEGFAGRQYR